MNTQDFGDGLVLDLGAPHTAPMSTDEMRDLYSTRLGMGSGVSNSSVGYLSLGIRPGVLGQLLDQCQKPQMEAVFREPSGLSTTSMRVRGAYGAWAVAMHRRENSVLSKGRAMFIMGVHLLGATDTPGAAYNTTNAEMIQRLQEGEREMMRYPDAFESSSSCVRYFIAMLLMFIAKPVAKVGEARWDKTHDGILKDVGLEVTKPNKDDFKFFYDSFFNCINVLEWGIKQLRNTEKLNTKYHAYLLRMKVVFGYVTMIIKAMKVAGDSRVLSEIPRDEKRRVLGYLELIEKTPFISHHQHPGYDSIAETITKNLVNNLVCWAYHVLVHYNQLGTYADYLGATKSGTSIANDRTVKADCTELDKVKARRASSYYERLDMESAPKTESQKDAISLVRMYNMMNIQA